MISDVYDQVVRAFRAYECPAEVFLGKQYLAQHTKTLRVVMWQDQDAFAPPLPSLPAARQATQLQPINPRPVATRKCGVHAQLWATAPEQTDPADQYRANLAYLDALVNQFVVVLQQLTSGIYVVSGGQAPEGQDGADIAGLGYDMLFTIDVPVFDTPWPAQQLSKCSETWLERPATAEISVTGPSDGDVVPDPFIVPTPGGP